jgi:predicted transposase/invertase (TIGR01784 family)
VTVYNFTPGHNETIRNRSKALRDYSPFVAKVHAYEKGGMSLAEAIGEGVKYAIDNDIMPEFIEKKSSEVRNMLFEEYDPEMARQVAMEEGIEKGIEKNQAEIVRYMKNNGWSTEDIAANTGMSSEQVERIHIE